MKIPGYIRGLANRGNKVAQAFIQQYDNGDNTPYDSSAYEAMKAQFGDGTMDLEPDFENIVGEEPMTPEEAKASEVIEDYGDKYRQDKITEQSVGDAELEEQSKRHEEINIPYHEGITGRIIGENGDVVTVEYETKGGITRQDQFYKDEIEKANSNDVSDYDINEALADFSWQITDATTVDSYAQETADRLGVDKDRVLAVMNQGANRELSGDEKMSVVAGLESEDDFDLDDMGEERLQAIIDESKPGEEETKAAQQIDKDKKEYNDKLESLKQEYLEAGRKGDKKRVLELIGDEKFGKDLLDWAVEENIKRIKGTK